MCTVRLNPYLEIVEVDFEAELDSTHVAYDCINEVGRLLEDNNGHGLLINANRLSNTDRILKSIRIGLEVQFIFLKTIPIAAILKKGAVTSFPAHYNGGGRVVMNTFNSRDNALRWLLAH